MTRRVLWACAGANPQILALCPSEHQRYASLGAAVATSATLAAISGTVALATAANHTGPTPTSLATYAPLGVLYGAAIFGIDRFLVSASLNPIHPDHLTTPDHGRPPRRHGHTIAAALPRLVLACLIGVLIAEPLLLWLFSPEIDQRLHTADTVRVEAAIDRIDTTYQEDLDRITTRQDELTALDPALGDAIDTVATLDAEITTTDDHLAGLQITLRSEISGLDLDGTTGQAGDGPVAEEIRAEIDLATNHRDTLIEQRDQAQDRLDTLTANTPDTGDELDDLAEQRAELNERHATDLANTLDTTRQADGILARIDALEWLTSHDLTTGQPRTLTSVGVAVWLVRAWILLLDATPMLFKLVLSARGERPYEMLLAAQQQREINLARSLTHRTNPHRPTPKTPAAAEVTGTTGGEENDPAGGADGVDVAAPVRKRIRYPAELRRQAVQMVHDTETDATSRWDAICTVSRALGPSAETIRTWVRQADTTPAADTKARAASAAPPPTRP